MEPIDSTWVASYSTSINPVIVCICHRFRDIVCHLVFSAPPCISQIKPIDIAKHVQLIDEVVLWVSYFLLMYAAQSD